MELPGAKESKLSARYTSSFYAASDLKKKKRSSTTGPVHNVYFVQYDVPVSFLAQVLDTGTYFFSLYILRILAFYAPNLVYDTGSYFGGNHGSRV